MKTTYRVLAALALGAVGWGQQLRLADDPSVARYQANKTTVLAGAAEKVTVQATATSTAVQFESADIYCTVACDVTVSINGTAATATTLAITGPIGIARLAAADLPAAFSSSDAGSGTALKVFSIPAGGTLVLDLSVFQLRAAAGGATNFSIATSSIIGTARIQIQWRQ